MDQQYIRFAKEVAEKMREDHGPDYCHDSKLAKAAYAMGLSVQEASDLIAAELRPQIEAEKKAFKSDLLKVRALVAKAVRS